jgi:hypothetical protein
MDGEQQLLFYQRYCHARECGALFYICRPCYRGQRYCTDPCRRSARQEQKRAANRRHQQCLEGRLDHRDRQRAYRIRKRLCRVTDQGSGVGPTSDSIARPDPIEPTRREVVGRRHICCLVCGRRGTFIDMSKRRE